MKLLITLNASNDLHPLTPDHFVSLVSNPNNKGMITSVERL